LVPTRIIAGLGNPGERYARSRHNIGFRCLDAIARANGITFERKAKAALGQGVVAGENVLLVKPRTFMNGSGEAIAPLLHFYQIPAEELIVVYDDMDLPLGKMRIREKGSAGGHNGMRSIIANVGSESFPRLRVGIGRPETAGVNAIRHVLGEFTRDEDEAIERAVAQVKDAIEVMLKEGVSKAMNRFN
jgi:PTH1 family peptidyl-tRNA hydrolase